MCSSSPAVAARCIHTRDGVGVVNSQNITDPRLGDILLDELSAGNSAQTALDKIKAAKDHIAYRQLLVLGAKGSGAVYSGPQALGIVGEATAKDSVAGGNLLADARIPQVMVDAFEEANGDIEWRLLAAMQAAQRAGGEAGPVHSIGLSVIRDAGWRITDLRVDWTEADPIAELKQLLELWIPQRDDYVTRGLNPTSAPSYGVPGDE